jgi:type I restriction enzyme S subunit
VIAHSLSGTNLLTLAEIIGTGGMISDGDWIESKDQNPEGDVRIIQLADIGLGRYLNKSKRFMTAEAAKRLKCTYLIPGDLLLARMPDPIGRTCIFPGERMPCVTAVDVCIIRPDPANVEPRWLCHRLNSVDFLGRINCEANGATRQRIPTSWLKRACFELPPLEEQRRIAAILDKADALRQKRRLAVQKLDTLTQSMFLEMFGDPANNPRGFRFCRLGDLASKFSDGPFGSNLKTEHYVSEGVRVIRLQNIGAGEFLDDDRAYVSPEHAKALSKHECHPGDVLVGTLGDPNLRACIQPRSIAVSINKADCVQIRPKLEVATSEFICSLLNIPSVEKMASGMIFGQTRSRIAMGRLRELKVPVPPVSSQIEYSRRYRRAQSMKDSLIGAESKIGNLHDCLHHSAFRGEL